MNDERKEIMKYFMSNLFESYSLYNGWKMIYLSRSKEIVSEKMANRYVEIQNYHKSFFITAERGFLISFIISILHPFDKDDRSFSLHQIDKEKTETFILENKSIIDELYLVRNKVFAHRDKDVNALKILIPSIERLDPFFKKLHDFYNMLAKEVSNSMTIFDGAKDIKRDTEYLFMNLYRGEASRLNEIDAEFWLQDDKKISDVI